ncbi:N utilization substance protein B, partial [bacterium]|nr:N utilization substance protein B [bacterium]
MGLRRDAREAAAQYLYQREMQGDESDTALTEFYDMRGLSPSGRRFCDALLQGWM